MDVLFCCVETNHRFSEVRKKIDPTLFEADQALDLGNYKKAALIYADYIEDNKSNTFFSFNILDKLGSAETPWEEYKNQKSTNSFRSSFFKILDKYIMLDAEDLYTIKDKDMMQSAFETFPLEILEVFSPSPHIVFSWR